MCVSRARVSVPIMLRLRVASALVQRRRILKNKRLDTTLPLDKLRVHKVFAATERERQGEKDRDRRKKYQERERAREWQTGRQEEKSPFFHLHLFIESEKEKERPKGRRREESPFILSPLSGARETCRQEARSLPPSSHLRHERVRARERGEAGNGGGVVETEREEDAEG